MKILVETTDWDTPNHTYIVEGGRSGRLLAFRTARGELKVFNKPKPFDKRGRTFNEIKDPELLSQIIG